MYKKFRELLSRKEFEREQLSYFYVEDVKNALKTSLKVDTDDLGCINEFEVNEKLIFPTELKGEVLENIYNSFERKVGVMKKGFSMIETLSVIIILGLLITFFLSYFIDVKDDRSFEVKIRDAFKQEISIVESGVNKLSDEALLCKAGGLEYKDLISYYEDNNSYNIEIIDEEELEIFDKQENILYIVKDFGYCYSILGYSYDEEKDIISNKYEVNACDTDSYKAKKVI